MDFQTHMSVMLHLGGTVCYFVISIVIAKWNVLKKKDIKEGQGDAPSDNLTEMGYLPSKL